MGVNHPDDVASVLDLVAWHRTFGRLLDKLDDGGFWLALIRLLRTKVAFHTWAVLVFSPDGPPRILARSGEEEGSNPALFRDYCHGLYQLDPFYVALGDGRGAGLLRLDDVAPDCFAETDYFQRYFRRNVVRDEVQINALLDDGRTLALSLGARETYDDAAMGLFSLILPWLVPMMRQRWPHEDDGSTNAVASIAREPTAVRPTNPFEDGSLTERERQVCHLMLGGGSAKSIARRLAISVETVRSHRRHLYHKLQVGTQSELFALFWSHHSAAPEPP
ncbi:helix-turn-helix transcriptional regulator [Halomonas sp. V046]|uniref:helix-turn-helix transcriptional regulator n=1 Tax=Halomonas sp. V046 TaxID=3459611 RepID=UPI00404448AF